ncbi:hypothetical protein HLB35_04340 [Halomonas sp. TBZ9]|uniref:Uncharacterized protein n=1 Tax=Vreelandella azerica TaxID=2732867 RepID=A0A7Y3TWG9_9GAMM|nr:hypothetical protein [Halomonas azerica]NOG31188.1 hypothetical protein [Halomonas azerica]
MDTTILTILAIFAIWVSVNSGLAVIYLIYVGKLGGYRNSPKVKLAIPKKATPTKDEKPFFLGMGQESSLIRYFGVARKKAWQATGAAVTVSDRAF